MASSLKRLLDDATGTWTAMPKAQALRWYAAVLRNAPTILREKKFYAADLAMTGNLHFNLLGHSFAVNVDTMNSTGGNGYAFLREFFVRKIYFREFKPLSFNTCLDLGCNLGSVTILLKQLAGPGGRVISVDPLTYPGNAFREMIVATPGITMRQGVLVGESIRYDNTALHAMCDPYGFNPAHALTINELMDAYEIDHVDFVKMDIEGAEFAIFRDSTSWLDRCDNLSMEVHNNVGDPSDIAKRLQQAGFRVKWLDDNGYPSDLRNAGYLYASKIGSLKH